MKKSPDTNTFPVDRKFARKIAEKLKGEECLLLSGELGAGKTTFVRWLADEIGIDPGLVSSPSYTLVQPYPAGERGIGIVHIDLYRLNRKSDIDGLGLEDYLDTATILAVEWPELAEDFFRESGLELISINFLIDKDGNHLAETALSVLT